MSLGPGTVEATRRELIARGLALAGTRSDADRLSAMLRAEQVLVFTYEQVLASGVLPGELRTTAAQFLGHERAHVDALAHELSRVGGTRPRRPAAYGPLGRLTAGGAMRLLIELERAAISVYYTDWAPADTADGKRDRLRASAHEESFRKAHKAGVKIVFGTDMGGIPWTEPIAQEFPRMVDLGMSPIDAIKSATSRPAEMLEMAGQIGVIAPGAYADVIAVAGDPLQDIKVLGQVQFVMKDGKVFRNDGQ